MRVKFTKGEGIFILVLASLLVMGCGFRLFYNTEGFLLEVDAAVQAASNHTATPAPAATGEAPKAEKEVTSEEQPLQVNINKASLEELTLLPGVGPVLARRIAEYRAQSGPFLDGQQLLEVKGIGEKTLARMLPYVTVADVGVESDEGR